MRFRTRPGEILHAVALLLLTARVVAAVPDGPYVLDSAAGWQAVSVQLSGQAASKQARIVRAEETLTVPAVGSTPAFTVKLRGPAAVAPDAVRVPKGAPLFVVADTHGEYEILVAMLRAHKIIGPDLKWRFARGHLAVLGDVFDRGPNHLEILWLLYELEAQAAKAGGGVHFVLGNHEVMALSGDARYLHPKYAETARVLGVSSYAELFAPRSVLGQWLRSKPAVLKLDDSLCLHAGVSRALLDSRLTLGDINATVRSVLNGEPGQGAMAELVMGSLGPLWYRGYFAGQTGFPIATADDVRLALDTFGVRRILIGHTIVPTVTPLYGGKVIAVQVYPKRDEAGHTSFDALLFRKGVIFDAGVDGSIRRLEHPR
jgi:hypothetical protein